MEYAAKGTFDDVYVKLKGDFLCRLRTAQTVVIRLRSGETLCGEVVALKRYYGSPAAVIALASDDAPATVKNFYPGFECSFSLPSECPCGSHMSSLGFPVLGLHIPRDSVLMAGAHFRVKQLVCCPTTEFDSASYQVVPLHPCFMEDAPQPLECAPTRSLLIETGIPGIDLWNPIFKGDSAAIGVSSVNVAYLIVSRLAEARVLGSQQPMQCIVTLLHPRDMQRPWDDCLGQLPSSTIIIHAPSLAERLVSPFVCLSLASSLANSTGGNILVILVSVEYLFQGEHPNYPEPRYLRQMFTEQPVRRGSVTVVSILTTKLASLNRHAQNTTCLARPVMDFEDKIFHPGNSSTQLEFTRTMDRWRATLLLSLHPRLGINSIIQQLQVPPEILRRIAGFLPGSLSQLINTAHSLYGLSEWARAAEAVSEEPAGPITNFAPQWNSAIIGLAACTERVPFYKSLSQAQSLIEQHSTHHLSFLP
ncbi:hypothetical protein Pelo_13789 [Pelomyxa schiedti]|nr:hypothetical protein Pelo_13789 [Pelomyxa schiedti]